MKTKEDKERIAEELELIATRNGGVLRPESVVAEARKKTSAMHGCFEWDDRKAAASYRLEQARELIRTVRIEVEIEEVKITTFAYVRDPDLEPEEQGYVQTMTLIGDEERSRRALLREFGAAAAVLRRARELALVFSMEDEIDAVTETLNVMRAKVTSKAEARPH